jgi:hypothetical protein
MNPHLGIAFRRCPGYCRCNPGAAILAFAKRLENTYPTMLHKILTCPRAGRIVHCLDMKGRIFHYDRHSKAAGYCLGAAQRNAGRAVANFIILSIITISLAWRTQGVSGTEIRYHESSCASLYAGGEMSSLDSIQQAF